MDWTAFWNWGGWNGVAAMGQAIGALGTLWAVVVALKQGRDASTIRVSVKSGLSLMMSAVELSPTMMSFTATNTGKRPVTLESAGMIIPIDRRVSFLDELQGVLPKKLEESESVEFRIQCRKLARGLDSEGYKGTVKLRMFFSDTTGHRHWHVVKFPIEAFLDDEGEAKHFLTMI